MSIPADTFDSYATAFVGVWEDAVKRADEVAVAALRTLRIPPPPSEQERKRLYMIAHSARMSAAPFLRYEWKVRLTARDAVVLEDVELLKAFPSDSLWCYDHGHLIYEGHPQTVPGCLLESAVASGSPEILQYLIEKVGMNAFEKCPRTTYLLLTPTLSGDRAQARALLAHLLTEKRITESVFRERLRVELRGLARYAVDEQQRLATVRYLIDANLDRAVDV